MLIDFSDVLQICVYELGRTYLRLSQALCINIPSMGEYYYNLQFLSTEEYLVCYKEAFIQKRILFSFDIELSTFITALISLYYMVISYMSIIVIDTGVMKSSFVSYVSL